MEKVKRGLRPVYIPGSPIRLIARPAILSWCNWTGRGFTSPMHAGIDRDCSRLRKLFRPEIGCQRRITGVSRLGAKEGWDY